MRVRGDETWGGPPEIPGLRYESSLGTGGFAEVFRYEQESLGRSVAVKVLHHLDGAAREQFRAEAHAMARLSSHPAIVPIYQVGECADGHPYLVMQLCPPPHLSDRIAARPLPVADVLEAGVQLSGAVATAHRFGILHRHIKPANILFSEYGRPLLTNFGIARSSVVETPMHAFSRDWAPPEQIREGAATPQVDVYSLSATLWAALTGRPPTRGPDNTLRAIERDDVPPFLTDALLRGLATDPADRYESALGLGRTLQQVQHHLGLRVTAIELWDGQGRRETAEARPAGPAPDDRTELVPLDAGPTIDGEPHPEPRHGSTPASHGTHPPPVAHPAAGDPPTPAPPGLHGPRPAPSSRRPDHRPRRGPRRRRAGVDVTRPGRRSPSSPQPCCSRSPRSSSRPQPRGRHRPTPDPAACDIGPGDAVLRPGGSPTTQPGDTSTTTSPRTPRSTPVTPSTGSELGGGGWG